MTKIPLTLTAGLTQERLRQLIAYDPLTGKITSLRANPPILAIGDECGWLCKRGWRNIKIDGVTYRANRIIWLYMTGAWPDGMVDHKNRKRADDRWANLRSATPVQNARNSSISKANTSGVRGVCWHKRIGKWQAAIRINRKAVSLGYFDDLTHAAAARRAAEVAYFGEFIPLPNGEVIPGALITNA
jgi:hypothetical protein